jgi:hypothetical protein
MDSSSTFFFARPSFLSGFARTLDLGAGFRACGSTADEAAADVAAMASDWRAVGDDVLKSAKEWARAQGVF